MTALRRPVVALASCGAFALAMAVATPASAGTAPERTMVRLVNGDRLSRTIFPLRASAAVTRIARRHSRQMAARGSLYHSCIDCILHQHRWATIGENVGRASTVRQANQLFMHSAPHRQNILSSAFRRIGVGIVRARGVLWVTELFYRS